ncbi:DNA repair and recombination protein pif1 [Diplocarpon rosae]|nr:DNA repair and recombination protein pif1 [Diplocarpon rosae]
MLARANKEHAASKPQPKGSLEKALFTPSSPAQDGNIEEQFKKARQSTQSIGGFTGGGITNKFAKPAIPSKSSKPSNPPHPLATRSTNVKQPFQRNSSVPSNSSSSLSSIFSSKNSFTTPSSIDLTGDDLPTPKLAKPVHKPVEFDENDFDDDDDIDLDMEFDTPMSMAAPPKPTSQRQPPPSPYALPSPPLQVPSQNPTSSAQTWSSSSPSHRLTPPGAMKRKRQDELQTQRASTTQEANALPRQAKRRTLPWLEKRAEEDEISALEDDREEPMISSAGLSQRCFRCNETGHYTKNCKKTGTKFDFTPKEKKTPWNSTASAVAEEKKKYKDKQKKRADSAANEKVVRKAAMAPITLSGEQQKVLDLVVNQSKSVFFTGSAGTGKSVLMRAIIAELRKKYMREPDRIAVTASTGLAACNIGGVTLHSFGGIGLGKEEVPVLVKKIRRNAKAKNRWIRTKILVIDEISMVDGDLFDKLEGIARAMRNNGRPFGGIQLVITGDFFQLPPVPDYDNKARGAKFAFDAGTWSTAIHHTIGLTEVFRQKDPVFANMLNEMRLGKITDETIAAFKKLSRPISYEDGLAATELFPTRNEVENSNAFRMRGLHGVAKRFEARDTGTITDLAMRDKLLANMMAPKTLELKKGAQVMLIKNMDDGLVNGSLGTVIAFMTEKTFEVYDKHPGIFDDHIGAQDSTENAGERSHFAARLASLKNSTSDPGNEYPLIKFAVADGTYREILVQPEEWKVELPSGEIQAQRAQLPLILAWALSIHKAQGQTLERVKIDLKKIFEKGQAYVALSRATSQAGLEVRNFDKTKVMAHPKVAQFYNSLYSVNKALKHPTIANPALARKANSEEDLMIAEMEQQSSVNEFDDEEEAAAMAAYG